MAGKRGGAALILKPHQEQALRGHIKSVAAGKTDLTIEELYDLLCSTFPQIYSRSDRVANKRRKIYETRSASRRNKVLNSSIPDLNLGESCGSLNFDGDLGQSDELGEDSSGRRDVNGINRSIIGDLGNVGREMNENGDNVKGNNRPMFRDLMGMRDVMNELMLVTILPLKQLKLLRCLGVESIPRILLHGPPRCGKTTLARAIANEVGLPLFEISAAKLVSRVLGAPQENIRELFSKAYMRAPSIVFIDDIHAMTSKAGSLQKEVCKQLMACMDEPYSLIRPVNHDADSESSNSRPGCVLVIGATNRLNALDPALRRRFDREIVVGAPRDYERFHILSSLTRNLKVEDGLDLAKLGRCAMGFVAGDLVALVKQGAGKMVRPASKIEIFSTTPKANWDDVGGLELLKLKFERYLVQCIKAPEAYKGLGRYLRSTFLLQGPSGCGKTLIVEALANEAGAKFIHVKGCTLKNLGGGPGELLVRILFNYARDSSPCILFFDELEQIAYGQDLSVFNQLLTELNGVLRLHGSGLYVIAATNRSDLLMRISKMFGETLTIHHPTGEERGEILKALARNKPIDANVDLMALGKDVACENFSGADLSALMQEAARIAIDRPTLPGDSCRVPWTIKDEDFRSALTKISPSASARCC